jgi:hypothetical protein
METPPRPTRPPGSAGHPIQVLRAVLSPSLKSVFMDWIRVLDPPDLYQILHFVAYETSTEPFPPAREHCLSVDLTG